MASIQIPRSDNENFFGLVSNIIVSLKLSLDRNSPALRRVIFTKNFTLPNLIVGGGGEVIKQGGWCFTINL